MVYGIYNVMSAGIPWWYYAASPPYASVAANYAAAAARGSAMPPYFQWPRWWAGVPFVPWAAAGFDGLAYGYARFWDGVSGSFDATYASLSALVASIGGGPVFIPVYYPVYESTPAAGPGAAAAPQSAAASPAPERDASDDEDDDRPRRRRRAAPPATAPSPAPVPPAIPAAPPAAATGTAAPSTPVARHRGGGGRRTQAPAWLRSQAAQQSFMAFYQEFTRLVATQLAANADVVAFAGSADQVAKYLQPVPGEATGSVNIVIGLDQTKLQAWLAQDAANRPAIAQRAFAAMVAAANAVKDQAMHAAGVNGVVTTVTVTAPPAIPNAPAIPPEPAPTPVPGTLPADPIGTPGGTPGDAPAAPDAEAQRMRDLNDYASRKTVAGKTLPSWLAASVSDDGKVVTLVSSKTLQEATNETLVPELNAAKAFFRARGVTSFSVQWKQ